MRMLDELVSTLLILSHSLYEFPSYIGLLLIYIGTFIVQFITAGMISVLLGVLNRSGRWIRKHSRQWIPYPIFDYCLNMLCILLCMPLMLSILHMPFLHWNISLLIFMLCAVSGAYYGVFLGETVDAYGRLPNLDDWADRLLPLS